MLNENHIPVYGSRILFSYQQKPNLKKCMLWLDYVHLTNTKYFIHSPFNFDTPNGIIQPKYHVVLSHWDCFLSFCYHFSTIPSTLSTLKVNKSYQKKRNK